MKKVYFLIFAALIITISCDKPQVYAQSDSVQIVRHLTTITKTDGYRNYKNIPLLNQTAAYIFSVFSQIATITERQTRWKH